MSLTRSGGGWREVWRFPLAALLTTLVVSSCSGPSRHADVAHTTTPTGVSAYQQSILSDGKVTLAEYRAAEEKTRECMKGKGWNVSSIKQSKNKLYLYFGVITKASDNNFRQGELSSDMFSCKRQFVGAVAMEYAKEQKLTGAEREKALETLVKCLKGVGVTAVNVSMTDTQFVKAISDSAGPDQQDMIPGLQCMDLYGARIWPANHGN